MQVTSPGLLRPIGVVSSACLTLYHESASGLACFMIPYPPCLYKQLLLDVRALAWLTRVGFLKRAGRQRLSSHLAGSFPKKPTRVSSGLVPWWQAHRLKERG